MPTRSRIHYSLQPTKSNTYAIPPMIDEYHMQGHQRFIVYSVGRSYNSILHLLTFFFYNSELRNNIFGLKVTLKFVDTMKSRIQTSEDKS